LTECREDEVARNDEDSHLHNRVPEGSKVSLDDLLVLFEHGPVGIVFLSGDARILKANRSGLVLLGEPALDDGPTTSVFELLGPGECTALRAFIEQVTKNKSGSWKFDVIGEDNLPRTLSMDAIALSDTAHAEVRVLGVVQDVAAQQSDSRKLRENEALLRSVMDFAPAAISIKDRDGHYLHFNPYSEAVYGFTIDDARGKSALNFYPSDVAHVLLGHDRAVVETKEVIRREQIVPTPNGDRIVSSLKFPVLDVDGEVTAVCSISNDLTEQRAFQAKLEESEGRFRDFAVSAADWFWEMGEDFRFSYQSERFEDITSIPVSEVIGRTADEAFDRYLEHGVEWANPVNAMRAH
jgi:PAS domain S-box-containing protein